MPVLSYLVIPLLLIFPSLSFFLLCTLMSFVAFIRLVAAALVCCLASLKVSQTEQIELTGTARYILAAGEVWHRASRVSGAQL